MDKKPNVEVELKELGNGKYEMGEVRTNKKMELIKYMKEFQNCKLIENAKNDPNYDPELNVNLCRGYDCETCPHYLKDPNKEKIVKLATIIETLEELKNKENSEEWIAIDEIILSAKEEKAKLENTPIKQEKFVLWYENKYCPNCGKKADQTIRACETGKSYCSDKCAKEHVNNTYVEEDEY